MDKFLFGKLLGEIYRTQFRVDPENCPVTSGTIYGLINGMEHVIDGEIRNIGHVTSQEFQAVCDVLQPYFDDEEKLSQFSGFYEIEHELRNRGVSRDKAIVILIYMKSESMYESIIERMDSGGSPAECRRFDNLWI